MAFRKKGGKRGGAFAAAIAGFGMFCGSFWLLAWNERDAVRQTAAINEMEDVMVADVSIQEIDPANEGKLVHAKGRAKTDEVLEDQTFQISENAIRLRAQSQIYQWVEDEREEDDETVYEYDKEWVDHVIDSSRFEDPSYRDANDGSQKTLQDVLQEAQDVRLGAFRLSASQISQIENEQPYPLTAPAESVLTGTFHTDGLYYTGDPADPQIGDEKVQFFLVGPEQAITVAARQQGESFTAYETKSGVSKDVLYMGELTKEQLIKRQRTEAAIQRWLLRAGGFLLMWFGMLFMLSPIQALANYIPIFRNLVSGLFAIVTFVIAVALTSITIAVFWIVSRPLLGIGLIALAAALLFWVFGRRSAKQDEAKAVAEESPPDLSMPA